MRELKAKGESDKIDRIIMLSPPHLGAPQILRILLHGEGLEELYLGKAAIRESGETMPGVYGLVPSMSYFTSVPGPVIQFDRDPNKTSALLTQLRTFYPNDISRPD